MKYRYSIGDSVRYKTFKATDGECPACRHIETAYEYIERDGVITSRGLDYVMEGEPGLELKSEVQPGGSILNIPCLTEFMPIKKEKVYEINGGFVLEQAVIG